jgi:hypothetical protein
VPQLFKPRGVSFGTSFQWKEALKWHVHFSIHCYFHCFRLNHSYLLMWYIYIYIYFSVHFSQYLLSFVHCIVFIFLFLHSFFSLRTSCSRCCQLFIAFFHFGVRAFLFFSTHFSQWLMSTFCRIISILLFLIFFSLVHTSCIFCYRLFIAFFFTINFSSLATTPLY